ncbi:UNVERIFIED_CONTAM: hypothetical protein Sradi_4870800 [Sesamum radiatum]|uniref:Uncharacterized protein n=1 Tax=Sesamum radiatum TaxID=300843 RepID=A0AAW2MYW7_SESRA
MAMASDLTRLGSVLSLIEEEDLGLVLPAGLWLADSPSLGFFIVEALNLQKACNCSQAATMLHVGQ